MKNDETPFSGKSMKKNKGFFSISAVAKMFSIHQQTIRLYEREGFINPKRSDGNTRLFSEEDVNRLEEVIYLTHKLGINIAGVQMILKLQRQIKKMQKDVNRVFDQTSQELNKEENIYKESARHAAHVLADLKNKSTINTSNSPTTKDESHQNQEESSMDQWDINYEEE